MALDLNEAQILIKNLQARHGTKILASISMLRYFHGMIQRSEPTALIAQMMLSQLGEHERELLHFQGFDDEKINAAIEDMRRSNETMALLDALPD